MVEISRLFEYDLKFSIYPAEPHQLPHCHVMHKGKKATIDLENVRIIRGSLGPRPERRALSFVQERRQEFLEAWHIIQSGNPPSKIVPS